MAFITEIAAYIKNNYNLKNDSLIVIFPNKRAALMLRKELMVNNDMNIWLPQIFSIQEAMCLWSGMQLLDNIDIIYELIKIINESKELSLQKDIFGLASQMLKDFDEIDQYAVDSKKIFQYLNETKEIGLCLLDENYKIESQYLKFFSLLKKYYDSLRETLMKNNCGYYGMISRKISEMSQKELDDIIKDKKIIFAGFNALTTTEENIIVNMVKNNDALLLWDLDEYYLNDTKQEAGLFAREFIERHKDLCQDKLNFISDKLSGEKKNINIIAVSGNAIQTNALELQLSKEKNFDKNNVKEAVVLSDESLLIPVLNCIPNTFSDVQVTMGFPYSKTILDQFISHLFEFQKKINNKGVYFWSLLNLLGSELIKLVFNDEELKLLFKWKDDCLKRSIYYIDNKDIEILKSKSDVYDFMSMVTVKWHGSNDCILTLKSLLNFLYNKVKSFDNSYFISNQISVAGRIFNKIDRLVNKYELLIQIHDIEILYRQSSFEATINLNGSHDGLQIMGLLETRNLDFDIVHILSVNEGVLPQSKNNNSLIPFDLRKIFNLPTYNNKQAVYAYHFYRLLQNAENINIYYNTLADGMGEGEASRFIQQIRHELPRKNKNINIQDITYKNPPTYVGSVKKLQAYKTDEVFEKITNKLSGTDSLGSTNGLSPTSISCYLSCPFKFYLKYIEKKQENTPKEQIQSNVIGSIIHATFENLYGYFNDAEVDLEIYKNNYDKHFKESFTKALTDNNFPNGLPHSGFNYLNSKMIDKLINGFVNHEINFLANNNSFKIIGLEKKLLYGIKIDEYNTVVNLIGNADRIDQVGNTVRIIDYKTGSIYDNDVVIKKNATCLNDLTEKSLQLLIYKFLYSKNNVNIRNEDIQPGIFALRKMSNGLFSLSCNSEHYSDVNMSDNCEDDFKNLFKEIMNRDIPFVQTEDESNCKHCDFLEICKRKANVF